MKSIKKDTESSSEKLLKNADVNQYKIKLYSVFHKFLNEIRKAFHTFNTRLMDPK
ncbi:hypothetical protein CRE_17005 [Caenorhabditis remanei]|uniref:Uncharacterized protein n=1 Tax=Caenorhabditis remanei TaxID=31234 RepID=E3N7X7_CAERE|nr:hypothetical protein CRE_17005 [Caenorhabditis remanei]